MSDEISPGGSEILRHEPVERGFEPTIGDPALVEAIDEHLSRVFEEPDGMVFHELVSDRIHLDVHAVPPGEGHEWLTLVTSGMAERPMTVPDGLEDYRFAELTLALPAGWPIDESSLSAESNYWPIRLLKELARLPHDYETFLFYDHTVPNGDPAEPYAEGTSLCGALIGRPELIAEEFETFRVADGRVVNMYGVVPIHRNEMEFKLQKGAEALWERLYEAGVTELLEPTRESVIGRRRRRFGKG